MAHISEIAPDVYRISVLVPALNLQFNHFLIQDDEPLLFHTGFNRTFGELWEAVGRILSPRELRWIGFSHFESDECGALNKWLDAAPRARPLCNFLGAVLSITDFAIREPHVLEEDAVLETGKRRFRFCSTAHVPHGWDAGVLFEETARTLFCSDLFFHPGDVEPLTEADIVGRSRQALIEMHNSPFAYSVPYTPQTDAVFDRLAKLEPATLATMHGSSYRGDGARALRDLSQVIREVMG
jgi:flavorubredoxin